MKRLFFLLPIILPLFLGCATNAIDPEEATVIISFEHINNNAPLILDQQIYTNAVGQDYSIKTVKYFVSQIAFHNTDGSVYTNPTIHFVDIRDSETLQLELTNPIPNGSYSSISFVYGLAPEDNITSSLGIDLDRLMEWPVPMGGGYHYMKLEGDYQGSNGSDFFNFHAGPLTGKDYSIAVDIPLNDLVTASKKLNLNIVMNVGNWFQNPTAWDFEYWGSGIMGNPDAQATVQNNGKDVFSITIPLEN